MASILSAEREGVRPRWRREPMKEPGRWMSGVRQAPEPEVASTAEPVSAERVGMPMQLRRAAVMERTLAPRQVAVPEVMVAVTMVVRAAMQLRQRMRLVADLN